MTNLPNTQESPMIRKLYEAIHRAVGGGDRLEYGGSVGQTDEIPRSYHRSWQDSQHSDGYSTHYYGDRHRLGGKTQYSAALDLTFPDPADMRKYTARLHHFINTHRSPHYTLGIREFAGTLDSQRVFAFDCTSKTQEFGWDDSHLFHIHVSFNRRFVTSSRLLGLVAPFKD